MTFDPDDSVDTVVHSLSVLIRRSLTGYEEERTNPSMDADRMDERIDHSRKRVLKLRELREAFENEMARVEERP